MPAPLSASASHRASAVPHADPSHVVAVETTTVVPGKDTDTFVTQRAGKIVQGTQLYIPIQNDAPTTLFAPRNTLQSTLLLQKQREMSQVQSQLEKKRLEFAKRMEECREKQEELRAKQKQIRDRVVKFEKFLKENDAKRQRANLKAISERRMRELKEQELATLFHTLQDEQSKSAHILRLITKYRIYEKYLQSVVDALPPDYLDVNEPHINDIIMRYKTLVETNEDLVTMAQGMQDEVERLAGRLAELVKDKNDQILVYNSRLGTKQKRLDVVKVESGYVEQRLEERDNTGKERMRMLGETKLAIHNIHERITSYDRVAQLAGYKISGGFAIPDPSSHPMIRFSHVAPSIMASSTAFQVGPSSMTQMMAERKQSVIGGGPPAMLTFRDFGEKTPHIINHNNSAKALSEKLHVIQERILDLQHIAARTEIAITQERQEKARKQAALAADIAAAAKQ